MMSMYFTGMSWKLLQAPNTLGLALITLREMQTILLGSFGEILNTVYQRFEKRNITPWLDRSWNMPQLVGILITENASPKLKKYNAELHAGQSLKTSDGAAWSKGEQMHAFDFFLYKITHSSVAVPLPD